MKKIHSFFIVTLISFSAFSQDSYKGLPVVKAGNSQANYRIDNIWVKGNWRIAPEAVPDVLDIPVFSRTVQFGFYTDIDSIVFPMDVTKVKQFYVLTADNKYALTEIRGFNYDAVQFDASSKPASYHFWYEDNKNNEFLG